MYNSQLTRRDFLRGGAIPAVTALANNLANRLSTAVDTLVGLAGVIATHETSSAQDLTPQETREYARWFFETIRLENEYRENRPYLKTARCMPTKAILFDGVIDGDKVEIKVKPNDRYVKRWCCLSPFDEFELVMTIVPKDAQPIPDPDLRYLLGPTNKNTFIDDGLEINLLHPKADVTTIDVEKMEKVHWVRGGYHLKKYHMPEEGCKTEIGKQKVCYEGEAVYDPTGHRGEGVRTKSYLEGYYKKISHQGLLSRRKAELANADAKYRKYMQIAIKRDMAKRKERGICHLSDTVIIIPPGITKIPIKKPKKP